MYVCVYIYICMYVCMHACMYVCIYIIYIYIYSGRAEAGASPPPDPGGGDPIRHRLNGYLASWVPSPPGKHTFQNCMIQDNPRTARKKNTRHSLGQVPV